MAEIIDLPKESTGTPEQQLRQLYYYLYNVARDLNINFQQIGADALTDEEQQLMNDLTRAQMTPEQKAEEKLYTGQHNYAEAETLKSLIIKTAQFVRDEVQNIRVVLFGEESASGQFGDWNRKKGLRVDVNPDGVKQTYSYAEIVQGLKTYEINAKNYIKTGFLRTENMLPVYGVAIGKDVVTFSEDGTETFNDSNKVAELTADALSFFSNGVILAKYSGTKTSFYSGGVEVMYIQGGKIYSNVDLELGATNNVLIGNWKFNAKGQTYYDNGTPLLQFGRYNDKLSGVQGGMYIGPETNSENAFVAMYVNSTYYTGEIRLQRVGSEGVALMPTDNDINLGSSSANKKFNYCWLEHTIQNICEAKYVWYNYLVQQSSRDVKHGIEDMPEMGDRLDRLRPVTFVYDDDPEERTRAGLIYEEVQDVLPEICTGDEGQKAISYVEMIPMLLKEIQSLRARVSDLERRM